MIPAAINIAHRPKLRETERGPATASPGSSHHIQSCAGTPGNFVTVYYCQMIIHLKVLIHVDNEVVCVCMQEHDLCLACSDCRGNDCNTLPKKVMF